MTSRIEANQRSNRSRQVSDDLKIRRQNTHPELVQITDRCLKRVNNKGHHLLEAGKHPNKVKVACAREMVALSGSR
jgi:hypothetical protein